MSPVAGGVTPERGRPFGCTSPLGRPDDAAALRRSLIHVPDHCRGEPRTAHERGTGDQPLQIFFNVLARSQLPFRSANRLTQPCEVVRQFLVRNRARYTLDNEICGLGPPEV